MTVATPLSLNNIKYEFGNASAQVFTSSSGSVTAPAGVTELNITLRGAGGGSNSSYTGGDGGLLVKNSVAVTGGSTSVSYTVGAAGANSYIWYDEFGSNYVPPTAGGTTSVTVNSVTYSAYGGSEGDTSNGADGATTGNGDTNTTGGGNAGADGAGSTASAGSVSLEWSYGSNAKFSIMTRGGGFIPNHAQNSNIPTSASGLGIGDFSGASLNFTATVSDAPGGSSGYENGVAGTINRDQVGYTRLNTNTTTLVGITQSRDIFYDLFGAPSFYVYTTNVIFLGDMRPSTLGYRPFYIVGVKPSAGSWLYVSLIGSGLVPVTSSYNGTTTTYSNSFSYTGFLDGSDWMFAAGTNEIELFFTTDVRYDTIASQTITSGDYPPLTGNQAPLQAPSGARAVTIRVWGGGAGGTGGQGGGGGGYTEIINAPINPLEEFTYTVGVGGAAGANGNTTYVTSNTDIFTGMNGGGGFANGAGGEGGIAPNFLFPNRWGDYGGNSANGSSTGTSNGGAAGGAGGGAGGVGAAGSVPGGGGASGFAGARGEIQIEWKAVIPVPTDH